MFLKHVLGILTLQTGTIFLSFLFITLGICVLLVNALALDTEAPIAWIVILLFIGYMIVIWSISLHGAYKESQYEITVATILWTIYIIIWIKLVIYSFIDAQTICLESRCPDVLWLLDNPWHEKQDDCKMVFQNSSKNNTRVVYEKIIKPQMFIDRIKNETKRDNKQIVPTTSTSHYVTVSFAILKKYEKRSEIKTNEEKLVLKKCIELRTRDQGCMVVSIIVLLLYLLLLLFSWIILISYREEIILQTNLTNNI